MKLFQNQQSWIPGWLVWQDTDDFSGEW